jgi:carbon-monoxide dehydrogenase small subunit|tara:strand:+ start:3006 stop:3476 length:471 start_codon:yes stop_codon:yes gene_type:complete
VSKIPVKFQVNNETKEILVDPWETLLEALRDNIGLTGTKEGCSNGNCGACTVQLEGKAIVSCCTLAVEVEGQNVTTVEGLATKDGLDPLQEAFMEYGSLQCGFCTPGFLMSARALLNENPKPTEEEIRLAIAGNLCRCTGYDKIVKAIQAVAYYKK